VNGSLWIAFPGTRRSPAGSKETFMPTYDATIKALKAGVQKMTVNAAVKNIESWEATLESLEVSGVKTIIKDLDSLKKHLHKSEIDGDAVRKLIAKLGKETVTIASRTEGKNAEKVKSLGEALTEAAETTEEKV